MRRLIAALAVLCAAATARADAPADQVGARVIQSLVKIVAVCGDSGSARIGSGFVWGAQRQVVTDLHVVVGCTMPVSVLYFVRRPDGLGQTARPATVTRVLRAADLVLLTVTDPPDAPPLQIAPKPPAAEQQVAAWGFPLGVEAPIDTKLQVTFANDLFPQLASTLDDAARAELTELHFPALDSEVLHLSGPLQPGDSGAPVVDAAGDVVGIGSGGLQQGAASISWAMRARYLSLLAISTDAMPPAGTAGSLFAVVSRTVAAGQPTPPQGVRCGASTLTYRGKRSLAELTGAAGAEVPTAKLARLEAGAVPAATLFDVWVEPVSGAAAVVPHGAVLTAGDDFCHADAGPKVSLLIRLEPLPADPATPEWALAVAQRRFQALGLYARAVGSGLMFAHNLGRWKGESVANGALVRRVVQQTKEEDARVYRVDLEGRGVSLAEGAVVETREEQAPADTKAALAQALAAVALATFAPPDRTQAGAIAVAPTADDDADSVPATPGATLYPAVKCGVRFLLMSRVPTFGALAAGGPDAAAVASAVQQAAGVSADRIVPAQYDLWALDPLGIAVLVPRAMRLETATADACRFAAPGQSAARVAVLERTQTPLADVTALRDVLSAALGVTVDDLHPMTGAAPRAPVWQADGTNGAQTYRVVVGAQRRADRTVIEAAAAPADPASALWLASATAGVLLAPGVTQSLVVP